MRRTTMCHNEFHKHRFLALGLMILMLAQPESVARSQQLFTHLSVNEGLSQSTVFAISQDAKGFMWFGTRGGGLNRYDGYEFQVYRHIPEAAYSLSENTIQSVLEDSRGRLWVGTRDGGVNLFDLGTKQFKHYIPRRGSGKVPSESRGIRKIYEDRQGRIWIGSKFGVFVFNDADERFDHALTGAPFPVKGVTGICEDSLGHLYFSTWDRIVRYHPQKEDYAQLVYSADPFGVFGGRINPLLLDSRNRLWIGTPEGIKLVDLRQGFQYSTEGIEAMDWPASFAYVRTILETRSGTIWFGSEDGLYALEPGQQNLIEYKTDPGNPNSLVHNSIYSLFEDRAGTLWVGTWSGISVLDKRMYRFRHFHHQHNDASSLRNNIISSFQEDGNGTWIGTEQGGLNYMNKQRNAFTAYLPRENDPASLPNNNVKSMFSDSRGQLWVGTYNGGLSLHLGKGRFQNFMLGHSVYSITELPGEKLYVGSKSGLYALDLQTREVSGRVFPLSSGETELDAFIITLFKDSEDRLWIGTRFKGIYLLDPDRETVEWFQSVDEDTTTLSGNYVIAFCEDPEGRIWVGTNSGLNMFNREARSFTRISHDAGFDATVINGILADGTGKLWISTNNGIFRFDPASEDVRHYVYLDGLQSNEFNRGACYLNSQGEMFFGGVYGFNVFRPEEIKMNPDPPPVVISDLKLFNKSVVPGEKDSPLEKHISETGKITLSHRQSSFGFEFVALNYLLPEKNSYAFKLEGYEDEWNYSGRTRSASYMNLKPGSYTFRAMGSNNDNVWNLQGASVDIVVKGPPWTSPPAILLYVLLMSALLLFLIRIVRYRAHKENELRLERMEKDKLKELNNMRLQFFTNISHEFRTPLTLIAGPLEKISSGKHVHQQDYLLGLMKSNVNRMLRLVNQLMDFRKLENEKMHLKVSEGNLDEFLSQIVLGFEDLANSKMIELKYQSRIDVPENTLQWFDEGIMDKVAYNLLSNAIKFTGEQGIIELSLEVDEGNARIQVSDTGKGIDQDKVRIIFERFYSESPEMYSGTGIGLSLSKKLIDLHRGSISVSSEKDKGSAFLVSIPVRRDAYGEEELVSEKEAFVYDRPGLDSIHEKLSLREAAGSDKSKGKLMLIAEDNPELSSYLADHFKNYQVILTSDGKAALEQARKHIPDIVVSDVMMPEMDGIALCKELKEEFLTSHIPVILLSAKAAVDEKVDGIASGADAYVEKPFDADYLSAIVKNLLKQRKKLRQKFAGTGGMEEAREEWQDAERLFMEKVNEIVKPKLSDPSFSVEQLMREIGMSRSQLYRKFKAISERNPSEYIRILRLQHALELLKMNGYSVNEVAYMSGFSNVSYFNTCFKRHFGTSPGKYLNLKP